MNMCSLLAIHSGCFSLWELVWEVLLQSVMRTLHVVSFAASVADQTKSWTVILHVLWASLIPSAGGSKSCRFHHSTPDTFWIMIHSVQILTCATTVTCPMHTHSPGSLEFEFVCTKLDTSFSKGLYCCWEIFSWLKLCPWADAYETNYCTGFFLLVYLPYCNPVTHKPSPWGSHKWESLESSLLICNSRYLGMANEDMRLWDLLQCLWMTGWFAKNCHILCVWTTITCTLCFSVV